MLRNFLLAQSIQSFVAVRLPSSCLAAQEMSTEKFNSDLLMQYTELLLSISKTSKNRQGNHCHNLSRQKDIPLCNLNPLEER